jgi:hypothetical protein
MTSVEEILKRKNVQLALEELDDDAIGKSSQSIRKCVTLTCVTKTNKRN